MARSQKPGTPSDIFNSVWDPDAKVLRLSLVDREDMQMLVHPFGQGNLTTSGTAFGTAKVTTGTVYEAVDVKTVLPNSTGTITELEIGVTVAINSSGTSNPVLVKLQGRNTGGTFVDISAVETYAANASAVKEITFSGRVGLTGSLNRVPFDLQAAVLAGTAGETGTAKIKNSSYCLVTYNSGTR